MTDEKTTGEDIASTAAAALEDAMDAAAGYAKRQWHENPVGVVVAAAGLGLLLGLLLGRRR